jgi:transposase
MIRSRQQQKLMYAAAQDPEVAKKTGVSQKVAREFIKSTPKKRFKKLKEKLGCSKCSGE